MALLYVVHELARVHEHRRAILFLRIATSTAMTVNSEHDVAMRGHLDHELLVGAGGSADTVVEYDRH